MNLPKVAVGEKVWISKEDMSTPPPGFEPTNLGELRGSIAQYRGYDNLHLLEYADGWELHQDYGDPRTIGGFIVHIFLDSPEGGVSLLFAFGEAVEKYKETGSLFEAIGVFIERAIMSYLAAKILVELLRYLSNFLTVPHSQR